MQFKIDNRKIAVFFSVALHVIVLSIVNSNQLRSSNQPDTLKTKAEIVYLNVLPADPVKTFTMPDDPAKLTEPVPNVSPAFQVTPASTLMPPLIELQSTPLAAPPDPATPANDIELDTSSTPVIPDAPANPTALPKTTRQPAFLAAPAAPTPQEWAFAAKYTLRNSKGYRYTWGHQVRSMMGTAFEGADQGVVRFRVEIAPDGTLAKLETLWTTSTVAEQRARNAIENMPSLPPTPTGKPLIFEKTISFSPFATDGPPIYRDDCLPEPPVFRNPYAWDGKSPQVVVESTPVEPLDPLALAECLKQLPQDTIEAESAQDRRLLDQWGSTKTGK